MAVVDIKNLEGKNVGQIDLPDAVFRAKVNPNLLHETVRWYQAAQRAGTHKTKGRGEVSGSGKKLWKQKGTGRARVGLDSQLDLAQGRHGARAGAAQLRLPAAAQDGFGRAALGALGQAGRREADRGGRLATGVAQDQAVSRGAWTPGRRDENDASGGDRGEPQSGTGQPESRGREAGRSARLAAVRFAAARPPVSLERRGRAARRNAGPRAAQRGACRRRCNHRSGEAGRARQGSASPQPRKRRRRRRKRRRKSRPPKRRARARSKRPARRTQESKRRTRP